ncbi:hypothetical protein DKK68_02105 [Bifidobacterium asteroides]|nr:hypothetical protein DKK68_02105 [Bifidobacterium asteroides]
MSRHASRAPPTTLNAYFCRIGIMQAASQQAGQDSQLSQNSDHLPDPMCWRSMAGTILEVEILANSTMSAHFFISDAINRDTAPARSPKQA